MTLLVLLFWTSLLIPGWALARRFDAEAAQSGLLGAVAISFVSAATVLSGVSIVGYRLGLPLWVLSAAVVALVLWGAYDLTRTRRWGEIRGLLCAALGLEIAIVAFDVVLGARVGAPLGADAVVHVGRVRFLLDHGLLNLDQFVAEPYYYPIYHTNLLHALLASAAQITGVDHVGVWFASLAFAKVLVVSGAWYAAWSIFRSGPAAWATALFVLGHRGPVTFMIYPNQLAPWFLVPVLLGYVVRAAADGPEKRHALGIAATALLIGQTHGMYGVFAAMTVGPALAVWAVTRWFRGTLDRRMALTCAAALAIALPFPAVTYVTMKRAATALPERVVEVEQSVDEEATDAPARAERDGRPRVSNKFIVYENGWIRHKFSRGFTGGRGWRAVLLVAGVSLTLLLGRRREMAMYVGVLASVAAWLYLPPLCALLLKVGGTEWMVHRFAALQNIMYALLVPACMLAAIEAGVGAKTTTWTVFRWAFTAFCVYAGAQSARHVPPYTWNKYYARAFEPEGTRHGRDLRPYRRFGDDLGAYVPEGAVVLAEPGVGQRAVMMHDCRIVASESSSVGVPGLRTRTRDVRRMLAGQTDPDERERLLEKYGVTHLVLPRPARLWTYDRMKGFWTTEFGYCIIALRGPDEPVGEIAGDFDIALLDIGRRSEAIAVLQLRVQKDPTQFGRRFRLANALLAEGRYEDALESYRIAREMRPDDERVPIMVGNAYAELGQYELAFEAYHETITMGETQDRPEVVASGWFNIGNMHYRLCEWSEAIDAYRRALRVRPEHEGAAQWLAAAKEHERAGLTELPGEKP